MYSGTTFTKFDGNLLGVHQKINRAALKLLAEVSSIRNFPSSKTINHFEGRNGPDGVKTKGTYDDVVYHFYDPYDPDDTELLNHVSEHYRNLVRQLKGKNMEKAAFEAAWLSHALVDGLTPAHHYPYEAELERIRGSGKETRQTLKTKLVAKSHGDRGRDVVRRNWQLWGAKGLITTHNLFEFGVAMILAPHAIKTRPPGEEALAEAKKIGTNELFVRSARKVAGEFAYDEFIKKGWTPTLARWVRRDLIPEITEVVSLAWYLALKEAGMANKP